MPPQAEPTPSMFAQVRHHICSSARSVSEQVGKAWLEGFRRGCCVGVEEAPDAVQCGLNLSGLALA